MRHETVSTILFEIITFQIRKPLNHVAVIAENLKNSLLNYFLQLHSTRKKQGNCNCNAANSFGRPLKAVTNNSK